MGDVLGDLAALGFNAEWHCIPACAIGAPHRRDRTWIIADAGGEPVWQQPRRRYGPRWSDSTFARIDGASQSLADADGRRRQGERFAQYDDEQSEARYFANRCDTSRWRDGPTMADADGARLSIPEYETLFGERGRHAWRAVTERDWWAVEPGLGRMAYGVPLRMDRLRCLGLAVVPQIPEIIGRALMLTLQQVDQAAQNGGLRTMRVNVSHMLHCAAVEAGGPYRIGLKDLADNLRELRDRTKVGDMKALDEFFALYVFGDEKLRERGEL
jgi:site-specific DNA-cytosine methylase